MFSIVVLESSHLKAEKILQKKKKGFEFLISFTRINSWKTHKTSLSLVGEANLAYFLYDYYSLSRRYRVTVGDHHLVRIEKSQIDVEVMKIFVHQDYNDVKITNDIALVKLDKEVELGPLVRTLCIPDKDKGDLAIVKKYGIATGWGVTQALEFGKQPDDKKRYSDRLQYSAFTIQSDQLCANKSAGFFVNSTVTFCAGDGKGGNDTCHGDSGGAFVREAKRGEDFRWVATGLISWGVGCAQKDKYGYYTRVYSFIDWIKKTMEDNS